VESGAGTWLIVNTFLTLPLLCGHHHATTLRCTTGTEGVPGRFPKASLAIDG
jgi:hypothetical protein